MMADKNIQHKIGVVSRMLRVHEQTIRHYETLEIIKPKRLANKVRVFDQNDITRINLISFLTQQLGLNLIGVKLILLLAKRFHLQDDELLDFIEDHRNDLLN